MDLSELLTTSQAAEIAGRTTDAMKRACYRGRLEGKKLSGGWVTTRHALDLYIRETNRRRGKRRR